MTISPKSAAAFERYCADPVVQEALRIDEERGRTLTIDLLRDAFMSGVKYGVDLYLEGKTSHG